MTNKPACNKLIHNWLETTAPSYLTSFQYVANINVHQIARKLEVMYITTKGVSRKFKGKFVITTLGVNSKIISEKELRKL